MLAFPKEALCLVGIVVWDFSYSLVVKFFFVCVMCINVMCVSIVNIFTNLMKFLICYISPTY